jgi:hypothetical protein
LALLLESANSVPSICFQLAFISLRGTIQPGSTFFTLLRPSIAARSLRAPRRPTLIGLGALPGKALRAIQQTHERTLERTVSRYPVLH